MAHDDRARVLVRPWLAIPPSPSPSYSLKVMTWNILAQTLVRRELFPSSDCLKAPQREPMLHREMTQHDADIMCFQEVDRLEKVLPVLGKHGYSHTFACGPNKKHGCLIAYRTARFVKLAERVIHYDLEHVRPPSENASPTYLRGASFVTRNIGSAVALRDRCEQGRGIVVATTHLFWHPKYHYERARQAGILFREVARFQNESEASFPGSWHSLVCGDFNFSPADPTYSLLCKDPLLPAQLAALADSCVVHRSIDPSFFPSSDREPAGEDQCTTTTTTGDGAGDDPDKIITHARRAEPADGLLNVSEMTALFAALGPVHSAYEDGQSALAVRTGGADDVIVTCGERYAIPSDRKGAYEPMWTSYTHYWKTVLDYIFFFGEARQRPAVTGLLQPPRTEALHPGMPRKGVSGSDHVSLLAQLVWSSSLDPDTSSIP